MFQISSVNFKYKNENHPPLMVFVLCVCQHSVIHLAVQLPFLCMIQSSCNHLFRYFYQFSNIPIIMHRKYFETTCSFICQNNLVVKSVLVACQYKFVSDTLPRQVICVAKCSGHHSSGGTFMFRYICLQTRLKTHTCKLIIVYLPAS